VLTVALIGNQVFWNMTSCRFVKWNTKTAGRQAVPTGRLALHRRTLQALVLTSFP